MSALQKVITITLMRADLYDSPDYSGSYLQLPASGYEIRDALERARIAGDQAYKIVECFNSQGEYLEFIPENPSFAELNFLARRISSLEDYEKLTFNNCVAIEKNQLDMKKIINITYNLKDCYTINGISNDKDLGEFYVENEMVEELRDAPDEVLKYLDYKKIGRSYREAEKGEFIGGSYVVNHNIEFEEVYDGINLPEQPQETDYVFNLLLENGVEELKDNTGQWLSFPASPEEINEILRHLKATSLDDCFIARSESILPRMDNSFSFSEDIEKISVLADRIKELKSQGMLPQYKAVLEFMDCTDIDLALDLAQNLDCFDFYPEMSSPEDYGRLALLKISGLKPDDIAFKYLEFIHYGCAMMEQDGASTTEYGLVLRNEKELALEYSQPPIEQQML